MNIGVGAVGHLVTVSEQSLKDLILQLPRLRGSGSTHLVAATTKARVFFPLRFFGSGRLWLSTRLKKEATMPEEEVYCHVCGSKNVVYEGPAEGYWCKDCGSSDQDE